ncbi:MAG TPA: alpha-L-fucosidase [Verrucomicrobiae bacterium]|nr:alpha-L-fucosidase [Verrucomicrobiae bacterium]
MSKRTLSFAVIIVFTFLTPWLNAQWAPMATDVNVEKRIGWWREARVGLFMHWGVYSILGRGEWVQWDEQIPRTEYAKLMEQFHPEHFNADQWAATAKDAGMRYVVLTSRHHDGFALFDDPGSDFTAMKSAAHHDFIADYVNAVRNAGLGVGLYYSPLDWRFPGFFFPDLYMDSAMALREQYRRQISELATHYGKLDILWFDGGGNEWLGFGGVEFKGGWHGRPADQPYAGRFDWEDNKVVSFLREKQPDIVINDRTDAAADFRSREGDGALGKFDNQMPWELCTTIVDGAWGYQKDAKVKPLARILHVLVGAAGRDGNFLLNVGPRPDGEIDPSQAERLHEIGEWLRQNGESIYGTRGGPWLPAEYGVSTHKGKMVYVHVLKAPEDGTVTLPNLPARVVRMTDLKGNSVSYNQNDLYIRIKLPSVAADTVDRIVKVELAEPWNTSAVVPVEPDKGWLHQ